MAVWFDDIMEVNIDNGMVFRSFANKMICAEDSEGNRFGVKINKGNAPVALDGCTCVGYFIRPDGNTVAIEGTISENLACVQLPKACYAYNGNFKLTIKIISGDYTVSARVIDGTIIETGVGGIIDPGSLIPDLSDYLELIDRIETAAETIESISIENIQISGTRYKISVTTS